MFSSATTTRAEPCVPEGRRIQTLTEDGRLSPERSLRL